MIRRVLPMIPPALHRKVTQSAATQDETTQGETTQGETTQGNMRRHRLTQGFFPSLNPVNFVRRGA